MKKIIDLHQDILLHQRSPAVYKYQNQTSVSQILESDIRLVFGTGFVFGEDDNVFDKNCLELIEKDIDEYIQYEKDNEGLLIVKSKKDLEHIDDNSDATGIIIHIEGLNTFQDCEEDWNQLENFYKKGLRSIGIVWTKENSLGGGDTSDGGLTELGKKFILWARNKNILIDFAHMNEKTFFDVVNLATAPVLISHGNARSVCANKRNYTDEQLMKVKDTQGLIGVFFANSCLVDEGMATIEDVVKHIKHIKELIGIDRIALGSDLGGLVLNIPEGLRDVSGLDNLRNSLIQIGFTEEEVEKVFYANAHRFLMASFL